MGGDVAIKILTPSTDGEGYEERVVSRFLREGRLISELHDPHTITLHDYGRSASGLLYMVFEFVDGTPLDQLIRNDAPMPPTRVARIMLQVLASLTEAHLVGVLHRDIKPSNLMVYDYLGDTDRVKVLDFGIAKPVASEREVSAELTREGVIIGTPRYMSPEQVIGTELTPASDIFSVGLVALEMLSGRRALKGDDDQSVLRALLGPESVEIPDDILIPAPMRAIIERMVDKEVGERFGSTIEVIEAIHAWLSGRAVDDWIDPVKSKSLERLHTRELTGPKATALSAFKETTALQWSAMLGVFLLGGLSTFAVFRVTDLQETLQQMRKQSREAPEPASRSLAELGETEWVIDPETPGLTYRFMGADGVVATDDFDKVPARALLVLEVVVDNLEPPEENRWSQHRNKTASFDCAQSTARRSIRSARRFR
jgi:serine/threonine protein kinase